MGRDNISIDTNYKIYCNTITNGNTTVPTTGLPFSADANHNLTCNNLYEKGSDIDMVKYIKSGTELILGTSCTAGDLVCNEVVEYFSDENHIGPGEAQDSKVPLENFVPQLKMVTPSSTYPEVAITNLERLETLAGYNYYIGLVKKTYKVARRKRNGRKLKERNPTSPQYNSPAKRDSATYSYISAYTWGRNWQLYNISELLSNNGLLSQDLIRDIPVYKWKSSQCTYTYIGVFIYSIPAGWDGVGSRAASNILKSYSSYKSPQSLKINNSNGYYLGLEPAYYTLDA